MRRAENVAVCLLLLFVSVPAMPASQRSQPAPPRQIFRFETDEFWLNLHHFLYVLGRAQMGAPDSKREAVVHAPEDAQAGVARLSSDEQQAWRDAVTFYANTVSKKNVIFDEPLPTLSLALAAIGDDAKLGGIDADAEIRATLSKAAPIYRKAWWPAHRGANRARRDELQKLVTQAWR